ncbi:MAG: DUF4240 domain-containing protein [Prevotella shahii]|jgi:hypothetical protein|uniref:Uncharacterized protein DUF4240 n=1 Tax=Hoylesella shahii DSM 15611 = JCM 12083 TaxID=1122991 RepID=A0A318HUC4_9BACT|nr:DUF4240 domain-containing protein [Hoylesella shahii]MBF1575732.1 DUF4240 domain-containing protein [Hoylesella shahii]MBF1589643.1 DUF4240 domain-containing protein [Hoylesella shahii]MBF1604978.1 DUF4240 domain-containing protein [Hoylesella shahii]PXX22034.1 uncharacterized protein DUF4240 [Hoylesella shahii DSM 15611 = JCM 12083]
MDKQRKQELAELKPTAEMMNEDQFWAIVQKAVDEAGDDEDEYLEVVMHELSKLSLKEMVGFRLRTDKLLYDSYTSEMWCAGYLMNGGCSDDGFEYFRLWVISRGRKVYEAALANPDNLIDYIAEDAEVDFFEFELFWYAAIDAFEEATEADLYDYIDDDNFTTREGNYPNFEFNWDEEDPESMKKLCPRLFERFD